MKLIHKTLFASVALLAFAACKEENPGVILTKPTIQFYDTTYLATAAETPQSKNSLVEDLTGARCSNCPKGHRAIEDMQQRNPNRIVALSIHGRDFPQFTTPVDSTKDVDMRTTYDFLIYNIVGRPGGLPFGTIDRVHKSPTAGTWEGYALNRMALPTPVNLYIEKDYNAATRELNVKLKAVFTTDTLTIRPFFSAGIAESGIITPQKDEDLASDPVKKGVEPNYVHNHVLRTMVAFKEPLLPTTVTGMPEKNRVVEKSFSIKLKDDWNADKCSIVFYVHRDADVMHVIEKKLK